VSRHGKKYLQVRDVVSGGKIFSLPEAIAFLKEHGYARFDETAEVALRLGVDPTKSDQMVRGTVHLPHGTGKPVRVVVFADGREAGAAREAGAEQIALLRTNSAYPAPPDEMDLRTIPHMAEMFGVPVGLSDHTLGIAVPVAAVAMGAALIEKHLTLSRSVPGPDSAFSLEPHEFKAMVDAVRTTEKALGGVRYGPTEKEGASRAFRRSLFVVRDIRAGETFTAENVRSIRPAHGLHPRYYEEILGRRAKADIEAGTPLGWDLIE